MRDDRELMKLEGAEAISQLQELENISKFPSQAQDMLMEKTPPPHPVKRLPMMDLEAELIG
jgi:hypothetical protein